MPLKNRLSKPKFEARWPAGVVWALAWGLLWYLDGALNLGNLALLLVLASAVAGLWSTAVFSIISSALSVLMFNWFFVEPRFTFSVNFHQDMLLLLTMLGVSSVVSYLMVRLRIAADLESQHAQASEELRALSESLREFNQVQQQAAGVHSFLEQHSGCEVALHIAAHEVQEQFQIGTLDAEIEQGLLACMKQLGALGPGTGRHENQQSLFLPLRGRVRALGAVVFKEVKAHHTTPFNRDFLQQVCDLFGLEIERAQTLRIAQLAQSQAQSNALKNTLLTSVSHDYRTPLSNLMGAASVIHTQTSKLSTEKIATLAKTVLEEAQHLNRMTTNTLQLARLDASPVTIQQDWESLQELLGAVLAKARLRYPNRHFEAEVPAHLPLVHCDGVLLVQLFDNLIDNAVSYSPPHTPIALQGTVSAETVVVRVIDQGPGIAGAWKEKVFHVFERIQANADHPDATDNRQLRRGMGVGLAVCMAIAKVHQAKLWIEDNLPTGAVLCLALPLVQQPAVMTENDSHGAESTAG